MPGMCVFFGEQKQNKTKNRNFEITKLQNYEITIFFRKKTHITGMVQGEAVEAMDGT